MDESSVDGAGVCEDGGRAQTGPDGEEEHEESREENCGEETATAGEQLCVQRSESVLSASGASVEADDPGICEGCNRYSDRVIRRLNRRGGPRWCDPCHAERDFDVR
jgi:hypothetical protein